MHKNSSMKKTGIIDEQMKMAEVIHLDHNLLPVINRFGISLGFGEKTVEGICREKNISTSFFLEVLNTFHDTDYFPRASLLRFPVKWLLDYLKKTHNYYLDIKVPQLEILIKELIREAAGNARNMQMIEKFFLEYRAELTDHIEREEEKVYPYINNLERALNIENPDQELRKNISLYSIEDFENEHDDVEVKLNDLKNIIIKYLPAPAEDHLCNDILFLLFQLEKDLRDHSRLEEKILVPMVASLEEKYAQKAGHE